MGHNSRTGTLVRKEFQKEAVGYPAVDYVHSVYALLNCINAVV